MTADSVPVRPPAVDLTDVTVSAVLRAAPGDGWDVTVVVSRAPGQPQLPATDVTAVLVDSGGQPLPLLDRDQGLLVEAGGGLGVSANAAFRFAPGSNPPARLTVTYRGTPAEFDVDDGAGTDG